MNVEPISDRTRLEQLRPHWSALYHRCPWATPFQSPEWLLAWWDVFHPGEIQSLAIHDGGRLVGLAPLYRGEDGIQRFLGAGISDYLDILAEPGTGAATAVVQNCQNADLMELRAESPLLAARTASGVSSVCPVLRLPARPGYNLRRNVQRYGKRLAREGQVAYEAVGGEPWPEYLEALFGLHGARWEARDEPGGVFADPRVRQFHRGVAPGLAARAWLRLFGLRLDGTLVAVMYTFLEAGRAYFYLSGFAPELSRFAPGVLLLNFALETLAAEGTREADFLRGRESYKYQWGAEDRPNYRLRIESAEPTGTRNALSPVSGTASQPVFTAGVGNAAGGAAPDSPDKGSGLPARGD
jgi:CelD/BcsL family acetyltransferase involved in cellulose biosynthesis